MSVILGSEIARLVFGYLQDEQLDEAATAFCKTSPYLVEEYDWLQRGYRAFKISELCLVDIIREHCEIRYAVAEYIESLPLSLGETLKLPNSLSGKINSIFDLLTNTPKPTSRKRPYSLIATNSTEATQSNDLPGYEPPFKERRLSRKLILDTTTPKQSSIWTPTLKQHVQEQYVSDDQDEENMSPEEQQSNVVERSRNETSQYPIFTETILENTQFQNVLVDNINRMLETSNDRIDVSTESGTHETVSNNNSLQEQVKHAIDNIIMSTEQDPTFQQVLDDVVQHTAIHEQTTRSMSNTNDALSTNSNGNTESPVPLKHRLRNRSQDKPRPNYNENDPNTKKAKGKKGKVEVISNEIVSGEIRDLLNPTTTTTTVRTDSYVPLNQILYLNSDKSTTSTFNGQDLVYVNVSSCAPNFSQFRIDADTPMILQDISLANSGASTSLAPGSIINLPTIEHQLQPIQSMLPNVIIKDIFEVSKTKQIERSIKQTPSVAKNTNQAKVRSLSSPRRHSHVRSLNFTTSDDVANENERLTNKRSDNVKKLETVRDGGSNIIKSSHATLNTECDDSNQKTSLEEVEPQQDSSDAVDFSKEFDEATVISVELSPPVETTQSEGSNEEKPAEMTSDTKKPQTRQQCQKDMERWTQMRQMYKGEWDNYVRQTVATDKTGKTSVDKKKVKKRKSKISTKPDEANVSAENGASTTTDIEAKMLEDALESAKKPTVTPEIKNGSPTREITKETNNAEPLKASPLPVASAEKLDAKNSCSPKKRSSGGNRKRLIHVKLPASAKKKLNMSAMKRRAKPTAKRTTNPPAKSEKSVVVETSRIDPSQTIDIDLISPIEHPKELNNVVKSGINLNSFLETPSKETSSFKYPITPGFAISSSIKTPGVRLIKDYDSLIKFPEYPTPSFAITPGRTKTPMSQSSSQKDGSSYNRATDYSSGSSYYKPDESDDIDKNLDVLIKENRTQMVECSLGVDPQQNNNFCNDQAASDGELSESSTSSTSSSSSQTSTTSSCSSSISTSAEDNKNEPQTSEDMSDARKLFIAQRTQHQLRLEQVRLRTMATLKSDKKIERFRKPKTKISTLQRHKVMDGSSVVRKPIQTLKMTGNSTPKAPPKVAPKVFPKPNPKTLTITPSKRKIATPRRVIYLDCKEAIKTSVRVVTHTKDRKTAEQLLLHANENATNPIVNPTRSTTPTETIDAIENHIAKTSQSSFVECKSKSTVVKEIDTPNLLQQLQDKSEVTDNASTPETMGPPATSSKRAMLVRDLFGDGTMSDSDFMDTPVKPENKSQPNVVPISQFKNEISAESTKNENSAGGDQRASSPLKINDKLTLGTDSIAVDANVPDSNESKAEESKVTDPMGSTDSNSKDDNAIEDKKNSAIENDSVVKDTVTTKALPADNSTSTQCLKDQTQPINIDSHSESDDDGDDYDDCTLISALSPANMPNRIYQNVVSDTKECAMKVTRDDVDLRPVSTYLDGRKISIKTCDEIILYSSPPPKTDSPTAAPPPTSSKIVMKKRTNAKAVDARKVEERYKKVQKLSCDETDIAVSEKNARFNIVAKIKGPIDATPTTSSRDQRKLTKPLELQPNAGTSNEMKKSSQQKQQHTKIPPLLKDMDINKVLGKIHPSKEIA